MSVALDRQIRPIYDALDTGSNKSAIVACNKLLKKHPKNALVQSLKALALVRSQKVEEALALCDEVLESKPTDDSTLNAMMHVLRGLGRHKDMITMYEAAYKQQPANEELGAQTFFANVRASQWKSAQQIASKMFKQFSEERYLYWSVMSAVLQANDPHTPDQMRPLLFKLAHRLITSSPHPSTVHSDRFHLHLTILREISELNDAMTLLDSDVGRAICETNLACNEIRRDIMRLRGALEEEGKRAEQRILEKNDRNWLEFLSVVDGTFANASEAKEQCSSKIANTLELFTKISEQDGKKDRSGLLGLLELEHRARKHGVSTDPKRMLQLLKRYFEIFGDKACCYEDLKPYLFLEGEDLASWTETLEACHSSPTTVDDYRRVINSHKLSRNNLTSSELSVEAESARASLYIQQYIAGLPLGKNLPVTELQHVDDLAILAGSVFVNIWKMSGDINYLYKAAVLLEYALSQSKQAFQMRLMLIRIYRLIGAPAAALEHYRLLGVKQVQSDTLSHFILSRSSTFSLAASGDLTLSTECLEASQIYISNSQETNDFVIRAFTVEKYSQIPQFITFEDWLDNSLQRDTTKIEHLRMRISHETISSEIIDLELIELKFIFDRLHHDNRDFEILSNYQPKSVEDLNTQTLLFGKSEGHGWLWSFLKSYIKIFSQASNLDDIVEEKLLVGDRPQVSADPAKRLTLKERLSKREENELAELTADELSLVNFADAISQWLEPFHDHVRPPASVVLAEAAKQTELKTGMPLKGVDITPPNGHAKKEEETPPITEAPEYLVQFFEDMKTRFEGVKNGSSPSEVLHVATVAQEAYLLFVIETMRFKPPSVVKIHKLGNLVAKFKPIRAAAVAALKDMAASLETMSTQEGTSDKRQAFVKASELSSYEVDHDFVMNIARKVTDSRKKVEEGIARGMTRLCSAYEQ